MGLQVLWKHVGVSVQIVVPSWALDQGTYYATVGTHKVVIICKTPPEVAVPYSIYFTVMVGGMGVSIPVQRS